MHPIVSLETHYQSKAMHIVHRNGQRTLCGKNYPFTSLEMAHHTWRTWKEINTKNSTWKIPKDAYVCPTCKHHPHYVMYLLSQLE